jgi:hypothetical protein
MTRDFVSDGLATDARDCGLIRGIDISHNNAVCVIKGTSKFMAQRFGSRKNDAAETSSGCVCGASI